MKVSIPVCLIPGIICIFLNYKYPEGSKIITPPCPGNIVINWQEKQKKNKKKNLD
ncbi:hypothetical protein NIES806_11100 [Dolichospermum compactum NIES-806]|uniref:Uncharacterized protein n=1 Tax=Dolichospermum compactum NIES-806 TaxID=1973481 RepID=A0A1Z4V076_9CYAN|nr:hypothetical protein NIES806_11100 [Dolichospermum compactum NIES-806]